MKQLNDIDLSSPHHAYLIEGDPHEILDELTEEIRLHFGEELSPDDLSVSFYDNVLLAHAEELRVAQSRRGLRERKVFILGFHTMISEAQNALLKTLEDPSEGTHFFFVTRIPEVLLPTVRSRMLLVRTTHEEESETSGSTFLKSTIPERLRIVERMTKAKGDDKGAAKDAARDLLASLEAVLAPRVHTEGKGVEKALHDILTARRYLFDRSPSLKLLLEHLALTLPAASLEQK